MKTLKWNIIETNWDETNPFANPEKSCNGGGYEQPLITGTINGIAFILHDTSCGQFGSRADLELGGFFAQYNFIGNDYEYTSIPSKYSYLVDAINLVYNTSFVTISEKKGVYEMNWTKKFEDKKNYTLEGCTADYIESIDRDQAVFYGKALYDYYRLINNDTLEQEIVNAEQMEAFAKTW